MKLTRPDETPRNRATRVACTADDHPRSEPRMFPLPTGYADLDARAGTFYCGPCGDALRVPEVPLPVTHDPEDA